MERYCKNNTQWEGQRTEGTKEWRTMERRQRTGGTKDWRDKEIMGAKGQRIWDNGGRREL